MRATKLKVKSKKLILRRLAFCFSAFGFFSAFCGCTIVSPEARMRQKVLLYDKDLSATYDQIKVHKSLTLDVLPKIKSSKDELLSQSESVVASLGQSKNGYKTWFTMAAFHEYELSLIRKYFFVVDERVRNRSRQGLRFDCAMALEKEMLNSSYGAESAGRIATLKYVLDNLRRDINELGGDIDTPSQGNKMLDISAMLIKQILETVTLKLGKSGVLAARLSDPRGVEFDHINFGKGRIQMVIENDIVTIKMRLGALVSTFEDLEEAEITEHKPNLQSAGKVETFQK